MTEALVGFGGNVGDVRATLAKAIERYCEHENVRLLARSSDYRTPPWGKLDQPSFINLCVAVETSLTPEALLAHGLSVERHFGRDRAAEERRGPRTLDIDVLTYGEVAIDQPSLTIPHPRILERAFVLVPIVEIRSQAVIAGVSVRDAIHNLDLTGIERLPPLTGGS